ncbi:MAG: hypothetical protein ACPGSI_17675, partial [Pikeienuella sp.]
MGEVLFYHLTARPLEQAAPQILEKCVELEVDAVEIHTGDYARDFIDGNSLEHYFETYEKFKKYM